CMHLRCERPPLLPYTTLFRSNAPMVRTLFVFAQDMAPSNWLSSVVTLLTNSTWRDIQDQVQSMHETAGSTLKIQVNQVVNPIQRTLSKRMILVRYGSGWDVAFNHVTNSRRSKRQQSPQTASPAYGKTPCRCSA